MSRYQLATLLLRLSSFSSARGPRVSGDSPGGHILEVEMSLEELADILGRGGADWLVFWPGFKGIDFQGILDGVAPEPGSEVADGSVLTPLDERQVRSVLELVNADWICTTGDKHRRIGADLVERIARHPPAPAPVPLSGFRFNDHLVWGAVASFGAVLLPLGRVPTTIVLNLLVVWAGLYLARGVAVFAALVVRWPRGLRIALVIGGALLLPYAAGTALLMGLADTWFDFRRGLLPPPSEDTRT